jgi:hypothetical protein
VSAVHSGMEPSLWMIWSNEIDERTISSCGFGSSLVKPSSLLKSIILDETRINDKLNRLLAGGSCKRSRSYCAERYWWGRLTACRRLSPEVPMRELKLPFSLHSRVITYVWLLIVFVPLNSLLRTHYSHSTNLTLPSFQNGKLTKLNRAGCFVNMVSL